MRLPSRRSLLAAAAATAPLLSASASTAQTRVPSQFLGTAVWVREAAPGESGGALRARAGEVRALYVKAGDGTGVEAQFSAQLVGEIRSAGAVVCAWTFAYGSSPELESQVALAAVRNGAQCLVVDAESQYEGRYGPAQAYVHDLRAELGAAFPIALASEAVISEHPRFPYSVFLAPGAFNAVMPQLYWLALGTGVQGAFAHTIGENSIYGRPVLPVGQLFGSPAELEVAGFRAQANAYGARGLSFFDLEAAQPEGLAGLTAPLASLPARPALPPTVRPGADGDEVIEAQELLNGAGAHLPVGGFYGAQTARAVGAYQARHRLGLTGVLGPATWRSLLRHKPLEPSWAGHPPDSAS